MTEKPAAKEQLIEELDVLRDRVSKLEALETEYREAIAQLKETQKYAQSIIDSSLDMIIAVDQDRRIVEFNEAAEKTFGYKRDEVIGKHIQILYEDSEEGLEVNKVVNISGGSLTEVVNKRKNGETFPSLLSSSILHDSYGNFIGVMGISRDITEQKKAEKELENYRTHLEEMVEERTRELTKANEELKKEILRRKWAEEALENEKERLDVTLRSIGDGVIVINTTGQIIMMNEVAEILTGWTEGDSIGESIYKVYSIIDKETGELCENPAYSSLKVGYPIEHTNTSVLTAQSGRQRIVSDNGCPIYDQEGKIIGGVLVFRDITEKIKMQEELLKIEKLKSIEILASGVAHDFNNLLTAILGNISLAKIFHGDTEGKVFDKLTEAEKASLRARNLTQQLLTFSKSGIPVLKVTSIDSVLKDSISFALTNSKVECKLSIPDDLWQVEADEGQIAQVINNIVINADQAMPEGGSIKVCAENIIIDKSNSLPLEAGKFVKVSISDQGVGISEENLSRIFDPYYTTKHRGNGLGLATSYSIIKNHKGHIAVESQLGVGSTFYIYIPATLKDAPTKSVEIEENYGDDDTANTTSKARILVMDDEDIVRETVCEILINTGYIAVPARDGGEAIEIYKEAAETDQPIDIVILDLIVPEGMGGGEAIEKLIKFYPDVKAMVSSGNSNDPAMTEFEKYGFREAIAKPYRIKELNDKIHKLMSN